MESVQSVVRLENCSSEPMPLTRDEFFGMVNFMAENAFIAGYQKAFGEKKN